MKKLISLLAAFALLSALSFAQVYSGRQAIPAGHWIYNALYHLNLEEKKSSTLDNAPLTVDELYLNFEQNERKNCNRLCINCSHGGS